MSPYVTRSKIRMRDRCGSNPIDAAPCASTKAGEEEEELTAPPPPAGTGVEAAAGAGGDSAPSPPKAKAVMPATDEGVTAKASLAAGGVGTRMSAASATPVLGATGLAMTGVFFTRDDVSSTRGTTEEATEGAAAGAKDSPGD